MLSWDVLETPKWECQSSSSEEKSGEAPVTEAEWGGHNPRKMSEKEEALEKRLVITAGSR